MQIEITKTTSDSSFCAFYIACAYIFMFTSTGKMALTLCLLLELTTFSCLSVNIRNREQSFEEVEEIKID